MPLGTACQNLAQMCTPRGARRAGLALVAGLAIGAFSASSAGTSPVLSGVAVGIWAVLVFISANAWKDLKSPLGSLTALAAVCVAWAVLAGLVSAVGSIFDPALRNLANVTYMCGAAALTPAVVAVPAVPVMLVVNSWRRLLDYRANREGTS